jgi:hypothetical protein
MEIADSITILRFALVLGDRNSTTIVVSAFGDDKHS